MTLFGHLAPRLGNAENLATEALAFVLGESFAARRAFAQHFAPTEVPLGQNLTFVTQDCGTNRDVPDLVGRDGERQVLVIEAKFWAGLTDKQPVEYLKRLPPEAPGILAFVAPAARAELLWGELRRRCSNGQLTLGADQSHGELRFARVGAHHVLALTSWRALLDSIDRSLEAAAEPALLADVRQIKGLCSRMDSTAFLPLSSEELSSSVGKRIVQFCGLIDDAIQRLVNEKIASTKGLRARANAGRYMRDVYLRGNGSCLYFSAHAWGSERETPIWLRVSDAKWRSSPDIRARLSALANERPPRLLVTSDLLRVPIFLPVGVEHDAVLTAIAAQVRAVAMMLPDESNSAVPPPPEAPAEVIEQGT